MRAGDRAEDGDQHDEDGAGCNVLPSSVNALSSVRASAMIPDPDNSRDQQAGSKRFGGKTAIEAEIRGLPRLPIVRHGPLFPFGRQQGNKIGYQRCAEIGMTGAAVFHQERHHIAQAVEAGTVDDGPALPLRRDQACPLQRGQMGRHGVVGNAEQPGDFAGGQSVRLMGDEPEGIQTRGLGEGGKGIDGVYIVLISRIIDMMIGRQGRRFAGIASPISDHPFSPHQLFSTAVQSALGEIRNKRFIL